jgi:23S rRNA (uridine2552-2'-O)-methyltransferase
MAKPYDPKDHFFQKAKEQGLRARSAFKIEEILGRQKLLGKGGSVLDLGAAPGGFLQILAEVVGPRGVAVGVDIVPIQQLVQPWVKTAVLDLLAPDALLRIRELHPGRFDLVTSDMAPKTIGVKITDEARSLELSRMALAIAGDIFQKEMRARFGKVDVVRPEATRERSFEVYVVGRDFKPTPSGGGMLAQR